MIEIAGKHNAAKVFTDNADVTTQEQIKDLCDREEYAGSKIRIMPDTHAGAGCTIGTTMTITDKLSPNLVGVDIGCGVTVAYIHRDKSEINFDQLDSVIRQYVPSGGDIREKEHKFVKKHTRLDEVIAPFSKKIAQLSVGTLGGGNHFLEVNEVEEGIVALVVHSGSRNLGAKVAKHYQKIAYDRLTNQVDAKMRLIERLKAAGRHKEIQAALQAIKPVKISKSRAFLKGDNFKHYIHDMEIAQQYAETNRRAMLNEIIKHMDWGYDLLRVTSTVHNYIDIENMILRKGAISARAGEEVIIPINMRDGSIIAVGRGNADWNYSGPHGAGRVLSRKKAKEQLKLEDFQGTMKDVWTSSVVAETLDEAPMAYKPMEEIVANIQDAVTIKKIIKPLYNFKATTEERWD
ncbi:tRNA splicing ligase [Bacillus phage Mater]|uniref:3'-phosphate/5'-hydroxy nucleic acid ligase n=1 Tax=Bacillus phage Mater TaxID=1540090 RepID=A0A0A0RRX9_9CAUD|nr:tRNA splicing ligase [Bacillus phage Mater]AIW03236.1 tRNA splicing ligase [Bacillus phage Mater]